MSHIEIGQLGEEIACQYLEKKGYTILDRNFRRKWGEIDIICSKTHNNAENVPRGTLLGWLTSFFMPKLTHKYSQVYQQERHSDKKIVFVEVKTLQPSSLRPEDNITPAKQRKLIRSCQLYLSQKSYSNNTNWQIDVIAILLDKRTGKANVEHLEQAVYFG